MRVNLFLFPSNYIGSNPCHKKIKDNPCVFLQDDVLYIVLYNILK